MRILVKESKPNEEQFLIYLMGFNKEPLKCIIANGNVEKMEAIKDIILKNSYVDKTTIDNMNYNEYITQE